jgi:hypothetical protein
MVYSIDVWSAWRFAIDLPTLLFQSAFDPDIF